MMRRLYGVAASALLCLLACGCGTYIPSTAEFWEGTESSVFLTAGGLMEYKVKQKVYCSIVDAIRRQTILPKGWAVQVTLDLQVDEVGAVNPGVSFIKPLPSSQSFTLGLGGTLSSQATREDKFGSYWELAKLDKVQVSPCDDSEKPSFTEALR